MNSNQQSQISEGQSFFPQRKPKLQFYDEILSKEKNNNNGRARISGIKLKQPAGYDGFKRNFASVASSRQAYIAITITVTLLLYLDHE